MSSACSTSIRPTARTSRAAFRPSHISTARPTPAMFSPASLVFVQQGMRWPYNVQANFGVQQQLSRDLALSISYVGAFSTQDSALHSTRTAPIYNTANPAANTTGNVNCRRPYDALPSATTTTCSNPAVGLQVHEQRVRHHGRPNNQLQQACRFRWKSGSAIMSA